MVPMSPPPCPARDAAVSSCFSCVLRAILILQFLREAVRPGVAERGLEQHGALVHAHDRVVCEADRAARVARGALHERGSVLRARDRRLSRGRHRHAPDADLLGPAPHLARRRNDAPAQARGGSDEHRLSPGDPPGVALGEVQPVEPRRLPGAPGVEPPDPGGSRGATGASRRNVTGSSAPLFSLAERQVRHQARGDLALGHRVQPDAPGTGQRAEKTDPRRRRACW